MIEDAGIVNAIPLPGISSHILGKTMTYCQYHVENPTAAATAIAAASKNKANTDEKRTDDLCAWDVEFCKVDLNTLFELLLAANYLDIHDLLHTCCKAVANNTIKGKTPEEIRTTYNITRDFTPEEEAEAEKEWE